MTRTELIELCFENTYMDQTSIECFLKKHNVCKEHLPGLAQEVLRIYKEHVRRNCPCCQEEDNAAK